MAPLTPLRKRLNAKQFSSDAAMKQIRVGSSMAKCTLKVASVLQKETFAAINLLTAEGNFVHMKTFKTCFNKLLPFAIKDAILTFEQLKVNPPYKLEFHRSPYNYELIFTDSSKVETQLATVGINQIPKQCILFDEITNGEFVVIKCGMDGSFGHLGNPPRYCVVVVDKMLNTCELYVRDMKKEDTGIFGSDKLISVVATCCMKDEQKQLIVRTGEDITVIADVIPESFFVDESEEPSPKKTKTGNSTELFGIDSVNSGNHSAVVGSEFTGTNQANCVNDSATLQQAVENFALVSPTLFNCSSETPIED